MWELIDQYREYDGGISSIFSYLWDLAIYVWNSHGILGVFIATMLILAVGIKNKDFGHFFTLVSSNLVKFLGGFVGFGFLIIQKILLLFGSTVMQAALREYAEKFKGMTNNLADSIKEKKTPRE